MKTLKIIFGLFLFLLTSFLTHQFLLRREETKIHSYGRKIEVLGKKMNVVEMGKEHEKIIVLDPGYGTIAPALDFKPLMKELAKNFHVYAIEPFGYGDSDLMRTPRTVENISVEFHEALKALDITEYILCAHSISGIYSIDFLNKYPEGVQGFIGLDPSVPNQHQYIDDVFYPYFRKWTSRLGFIRWAAMIYPSAFLPTNSYYTKEDKEQMKYRLYRDFANDSKIDEGRRFQANWESIKDLYYPKEIKKVFFIRREKSEDKNWRYLETKNSLKDGDGEIYLMSGSHYIHRDRFVEISHIIEDEFK